MTSGRARVRLEDMLQHAEEAIAILDGRSASELAKDRLRFLALCRVVEIVGEAAFKVPAGVQAAFPSIPFRKAIGPRHVLVHGYAIADPAILANTVNEACPPLVDALRMVLPAPLPDESD